MFRRLDARDLLMVEQPLHHDDLVQHAELQRRIRTDLCLDESIRSAARAEAALSLGVVQDHQHQAGASRRRPGGPPGA